MPCETLTPNVPDLRAGIIGGGRSAFIGSLPHIAAELVGQVRVVGGALSSHPEIARERAPACFLGSQLYLLRGYGRRPARAGELTGELGLGQSLVAATP
jgi:hypothetical protein